MLHVISSHLNINQGQSAGCSVKRGAVAALQDAHTRLCCPEWTKNTAAISKVIIIPNEEKEKNVEEKC